ncbi:MAG: hypothetical protein ACXWP5_11485 [Bdellovibrionota bacterium]
MRKLTISMIAVAGLITFIGGAKAARADVAKMLGTWNGTGATYSIDGTEEGEYQVQLVNVPGAQGGVDSSITVTIPNYKTLHFTQTMRDTPKGFSITSDQGSGGALCVGEGLCEGFLGQDGNGIAMTTISDGPDTLRILKTQLENGKAVRIMREKYVRAASN